MENVKEKMLPVLDDCQNVSQDTNSKNMRLENERNSALKINAFLAHPQGLHRLVYHNMRGRAELLRLMFAAAGVDFSDERIERRDWADLKHVTPGGVLPYMVTPHGDVLMQSMAIARYLAREFNFYADASMEIYKIEQAVGQLEDLSEELFKGLMCEKAEERIKIFSYSKFLMNPLEVMLKERNIQADDPSKAMYYSGKRLSMADLFSVAVIDWIIFHNTEEFFKEHPMILLHYKKIRLNHPKIDSYLKDAPDLPY